MDQPSASHCHQTQHLSRKKQWGKNEDKEKTKKEKEHETEEGKTK